MRTRARYAWLAAGVVLLAAVAVPRLAWFTDADRVVTTPREEWGHDVGDDYFLATYSELVAYWRKLERQSSRLRLLDIGPTQEGRRQIVAVVTSTENQRTLDRYRETAARLARAQNVSNDEARALARTGRAIVWIAGGIHPDEVLGAQQLIELVARLVTGLDDETEHILDNVIVLAVVANPDGMDLVANWYRKHGTTDAPVAYGKYGGRDGNRDFYMSALVETANLNRAMYRQWYPQIVYDHHQPGLQNTAIVIPPFREPANDFIHPEVLRGVDEMGRAMADRFATEGKSGVASRDGQAYSTWWNGGLRTTPYFHNMIGLLTETRGSPTPSPDWRFQQSIEYSMTANLAVLSYAARSRERLLMRAYDMARDEIRWGSEDHWTSTAHRPAVAMARRPEDRDARAYVIAPDQRDIGSATRFVDALLKAGIDVETATSPFHVAGKSYPAGSYVVRTAQAFRPHVLDMFEPQDHPDDFAYPGAPPTVPYDSTGYTLAFQMGIQFDRLIDAPTATLVPVVGSPRPPSEPLPAASAFGWYLFGPERNDSARAVNQLLKAGADVRWLDIGRLGRGTFTAEVTPASQPVFDRMARDAGMKFVAASAPGGGGTRLRSPRIAIVDEPGSRVSVGWTRLIMDEFGFPYDLVSIPEIDAGRLEDRYDALVVGGSAMPRSSAEGPGDAATRQAASTPGAPTFDPIPPDIMRRHGGVTVKTVAALRGFVEQGGTLIAVGPSGLVVAERLALPVSDAVAGLRQEDYFVPGSILRLSLDPEHAVTRGLPREVDVFFAHSPVFRLNEGTDRNVRSIGWFSGQTPLRSGWAWGAEHLEHTSAIVEATLGNGRVLLFGPDVLFRAQSHGTFKLFFNALFYSASERF